MITGWRAAGYTALLALAVALFHSANGARADTEPGLSKAPVLRIETGMHTAKIGRIAVHPDTDLLASVSYDKTLRLWSLGDGKLFRTLRVPIGAAREGALYGVAISPDGTMIATAGWTGEADSPNWSLYLFDIASGEMIRRVADLPHRGLNLAFSPDGQYLAVTFKDDHGFRVYRMPDFSLAADRPVHHPDGLKRGDEKDADDANCRDPRVFRELVECNGGSLILGDDITDKSGAMVYRSLPGEGDATPPQVVLFSLTSDFYVPGTIAEVTVERLDSSAPAVTLLVMRGAADMALSAHRLAPGWRYRASAGEARTTFAVDLLAEAEGGPLFGRIVFLNP